MSPLIDWRIAQNLMNMGWPREKGTLKKTSYADTQVLDITVEGAIQELVGIGAGQHPKAVVVLAEMFPENLWTEDSTNKLIDYLTRQSEEWVNEYPSLPPWKAIYSDQRRLARLGSEIPWSNMGELTTMFIAYGAAGLVWGANHRDLMDNVFDSVKTEYESTVGEAIEAGLDVGESYPWSSLVDFYDWCGELVDIYQEARPMNRQDPLTLREALV
jgi:hypothetical protein